jgi:hypothetical protein
MFSAGWKTTFVVTLAWAGLAWGQASSPSPGIGIGSDLLTVREAGRPDQKCRILKAWKQPDGAMAFEVQCLETEEYLTLVEMAPPEGGVTDAGKGMKSRIYHWGQSVTPPPGVPQMPTAPVSPAKDSKSDMDMAPQLPPMGSTEKESSEKPDIHSSSKPIAPPSASSTSVSVPGSTSATAEKAERKYELPEAPDGKAGPVQIETAPPSNWHESWGKVDDHHTQITPEKISQSQPINPQANQQMPLPAEQPSVPAGSDDNNQRPLPSEPSAPAITPNTEPSSPATLPSKTGSEEKSGEQPPDVSPMSSKKEVAPEAFQPPGYSYVDDRPGIAHVTDIPPPGATKVIGESKKPVVDFLRAMWKPSLKEPAPLQSVQLNEMPVVVSAMPDVMQIEATLQDSLLPSQREMAAEVLSNWDSRREPSVIPALLHSATDDPAGTVRTACVHCLVKMRANSPEVVSVLLRLKADPDLRVRREAHQALVSFGLAKPESDNETIHQISAPGGPSE